MLTVHHLGISQSDRIVWLCEELGLNYELKRYDRDAVTRLAPADYQQLTAMGTAPVITDGDLVLGESGAIIDYIIGRYGDGRLAVGPQSANFADYLFWFHFANGSLMPAVMLDMVVRMSGGGDGPANPARDRLASRLDAAYAAIEARLGAMPYLAGEDFTAADIITLFPLTTMRVFTGRDLSPYPNILAYLQRIGERPAFRRATEKADPSFTPKLT